MDENNRDDLKSLINILFWLDVIAYVIILIYFFTLEPSFIGVVAALVICFLMVLTAYIVRELIVSFLDMVEDVRSMKNYMRQGWIAAANKRLTENPGDSKAALSAEKRNLEGQIDILREEVRDLRAKKKTEEKLVSKDIAALSREMEWLSPYDFQKKEGLEARKVQLENKLSALSEELTAKEEAKNNEIEVLREQIKKIAAALSTQD